MGYLHIKNLTKDNHIFLFKECYALEKLDGTSAHVAYDPEKPEGHQLSFFGGCANYDQFVSLFDQQDLLNRIKTIGYGAFTCYGEAYGGKIQRMSATYGLNLKFCAFDIKTHGRWLDVPRAEQYVKSLGLEFVHYKQTPVTIEALDAERDAPSEQAIRNGCGNDKIREGIVCRPLVEFSYDGAETSRIIVKHKRAEFRETKSVRTLQSEEKKKALEDVTVIVDEYIVPMRLEHVLQKFGVQDALTVEKTKEVINSMIEDVLREGADEIVESKLLLKEIGNRTAKLYKEWLNKRLYI